MVITIDYAKDISGKQILVIPMKESNNWADAIVHLECNFLEYYDSYNYEKKLQGGFKWGGGARGGGHFPTHPIPTTKLSMI